MAEPSSLLLHPLHSACLSWTACYPLPQAAADTLPGVWAYAWLHHPSSLCCTGSVPPNSPVCHQVSGFSSQPPIPESPIPALCCFLHADRQKGHPNLAFHSHLPQFASHSVHSSGLPWAFGPGPRGSPPSPTQLPAPLMSPTPRPLTLLFSLPNRTALRLQGSRPK